MVEVLLSPNPRAALSKTTRARILTPITPILATSRARREFKERTERGNGVWGLTGTVIRVLGRGAGGAGGDAGAGAGAGAGLHLAVQRRRKGLDVGTRVQALILRNSEQEERHGSNQIHPP